MCICHLSGIKIAEAANLVQIEMGYDFLEIPMNSNAPAELLTARAAIGECSNWEPIARPVNDIYWLTTGCFRLLLETARNAWVRVEPLLQLPHMCL